MSKIKQLFEKHREVIMYIFFGVLTTLVGWGTYVGVMWVWRAVFSLPNDDSTSSLYLAGFTVAQVLHWIAAVLFSFFTNKKWVFTDADKNVSVFVQLLKFAGGRVITLLVDTGVTYLAGWVLLTALPAMSAVPLLGLELNFCDIGSKVITSVIVLICNYVISKIFVFTKKKEKQ